MRHKLSELLARAEAEAAAAPEQKSHATASGWEAEVLRRIAPRIVEVQWRAAHDGERLGWEAEGIRLLARVTACCSQPVSELHAIAQHSEV